MAQLQNFNYGGNFINALRAGQQDKQQQQAFQTQQQQIPIQNQFKDRALSVQEQNAGRQDVDQKLKGLDWMGKVSNNLLRMPEQALPKMWSGLRPQIEQVTGMQLPEAISREDLMQFSALVEQEKQKWSAPKAVVQDGQRVLAQFDDAGNSRVVPGLAPDAKSPGVSVNVGGPNPYKIPSGYMLKDPNDPMQGVTPIPGGNADEQSPEQAAKTQMLVDGIKDLETAQQLLFNPDGTINRTNVFNSNFRTPFTEGRELYSLVYNAIEGKLRAESGAAVPDSEVERMARRFAPLPGDNDETIKNKMERLNQFMMGTLDKIDPSGRFEKREQQQGQSFKSSSGIEFTVE